MAAAMSGPTQVRQFFLSGQEQWVAQAMSVAIELCPRGECRPSLPDVIDMAGRSIISETEDACSMAGLDDVQSETLMEMSRRGIEAFTKACGMVMVEEIRAGRAEPDWGQLLHRVDQVLPRTLHV
ncbi:hypothetical protein [Singulisphaera sp. GP187]|uniref:hypothetical protein n=1 Tax=Singulisphaera sp. GP187 TaxID=1882752 RepID=UPI0011610C88|nr:hypothetical protein [Singulisphaera sp. GP187]